MPLLDHPHIHELVLLAGLHRACMSCGHVTAMDYCRSCDEFYWLHRQTVAEMPILVHQAALAAAATRSRTGGGVTPEYAKLSLRAGYLAFAIEAATGERVVDFLRAFAWHLTPEVLEDLKVFALKAGVPQAALVQAELDAEEFFKTHPDLIDACVSAQNRIDRARRQ